MDMDIEASKNWEGWERVYTLYMEGVTVPWLIEHVIPKELGIKHRWQVTRELTKRYPDARRKNNKMLQSLVEDYPEHKEFFYANADKLAGHVAYSNRRLQGMSNYDPAYRSKSRSVEARSIVEYYQQLEEHNSSEEPESMEFTLPWLQLQLCIVATLLAECLGNTLYLECVGMMEGVFNA